MTVLSHPRPALVRQALADARAWCAGHIIDDRPALVHAVRVAVVLCRHVPLASAELVAAVLLHDSPEFAPPGTDLTATYPAEVARVVAALHAEHVALDGPAPVMVSHDRPVLLASTADKIVALQSLLTRARRSGDVTAFFAARPLLRSLFGHFRAFRADGSGRVPLTMTVQLGVVLDQVVDAARQPITVDRPRSASLHCR